MPGVVIKKNKCKMDYYYLKKMLGMKQQFLNGEEVGDRKEENLTDDCKYRRPKKNKGLFLGPILEPAITTGVGPVVGLLGNDTLSSAGTGNVSTSTVSSLDDLKTEKFVLLATPPVMVFLAFIVIGSILLVIKDHERWVNRRDFLRAFRMRQRQAWERSGNERLVQNSNNRTCCITFPELGCMEETVYFTNDNIYHNGASSAIGQLALQAVQATNDIQRAMARGKRQGNIFKTNGYYQNHGLQQANSTTDESQVKRTRKETAV